MSRIARDAFFTVGAIGLAALALASAAAYRATRIRSEAPASTIARAGFSRLIFSPQLRPRRPSSLITRLGELPGVAIGRLYAMRVALDTRIAHSTRMLDRDHAEQQAQSSRIAVLEERQRIMCDIHDDVGGHLIGLLAAARNGKLSNGDVESIVSDALVDLRIAIDSLAPIEGDIGTVLGALRYRLATRLERAGIPNKWHIGRLPDIADRRRGTIYHLQRIVTESITNAIKHSHATMVEVSAQSHPLRNAVEVEIRDNGSGYGVSSLHATCGIEGMRRRAALMGASIEFGTKPKATFVRLTIPVRTAAARDAAGH